MSGSGKKWAMGCGIGCGAMVLIAAIIGGLGFFGVKNVVERTENVEASYEQVKSVHGAAVDYVPAADGRIAPDRLEAFLAAREAMAPVRQKMNGILATLDGDGNKFTKIKAGIGLVPGIFDFLEGRNRVMIDSDIGPGEYQYIYSVSYYAFLRKDPADGPKFPLVTDEGEGNDNSGWRFETDMDTDDEASVRERRSREVRAMVNRVQLNAARSQLEVLSVTTDDLDGLDKEAWRAQLAAEVESLENEHLKLLWEDGLPEQIRESLEPFRVRLDASYDPMTSVLEMGTVDHD